MKQKQTTVSYRIQKLTKLDPPSATLLYAREARWLSMSSALTLEGARVKYRLLKQQTWAKGQRWRVVRVTITCCKVS